MSPITFTVVLSIQSEKNTKVRMIVSKTVISYNVQSSDISDLNGQ